MKEIKPSGIVVFKNKSMFSVQKTLIGHCIIPLKPSTRADYNDPTQTIAAFDGLSLEGGNSVLIAMSKSGAFMKMSFKKEVIKKPKNSAQHSHSSINLK